ATPGEEGDDYNGDANSHSLTVQNLSARELEIYGCPFCPESNDRAQLNHAAKKTRKDQVTFTMDGEGQYTVTDPNGKRIGHDFAKNHFVNEIPQADVVASTGGLSKK